MAPRIPLLSIALFSVCLVLTPTIAHAGCVFGPFSTCTVSIVQNPARPSCINSFNPDVVRLCPSTASPVFDRVTFDVSLLDALGLACAGTEVHAYEASGTVNIVDGELTSATSDAAGRASVTIRRASGCGLISVCAGGVVLCSVSARSPDLAYGALSPQCPLPTAGSSFANINDITNNGCGFLSKFGAVTTGVNDCWDLNCNNFVNANDVIGSPSKGPFIQHFGHGGPLGAKSTCP